MGKKEIKKYKGICAYCGVAPATTRDHVVPKCLFPKPLPPLLITAPVCLKCNQNKARDEQYLRDALIVDIYTSEHPMAKAIFDGEMARARARNRSEIARTARDARMEPLYTPGGVYLGHHAAMPLDWERISRTIGLMVRGLYWTLRGEPFPQGYAINVLRLDPLDVQTAWDAINASHFNGAYGLGDGIFACVMHVVAGGADASAALEPWIFHTRSHVGRNIIVTGMVPK